MTDDEAKKLERQKEDYEDALKEVVNKLRWCSLTRSVVWDVDRSYRIAEDILHRYSIFA